MTAYRLSVQHQNTAVQLPLPLLEAALAAPKTVQGAGLRVAHDRPLVSKGKTLAGVFMPAFRVAPEHAWRRFPELELQAPHFHSGVMLDIDREHAYHELLGLELDDVIPVHSWVVECQHTGHVHAVWLYRHPVYRGPRARLRPLQVHGRLSEYLAYATQADGSYSETLTHNPMKKGQRQSERTWRTYWGPAGGAAPQGHGGPYPQGLAHARLAPDGVRSQLCAVQCGHALGRI